MRFAPQLPSGHAAQPIILPTMPRGANTEGIAAAAETAERLGWQTAWTTDHILVPHAAAGGLRRDLRRHRDPRLDRRAVPASSGSARASSSCRCATPSCWPRSSRPSTRSSAAGSSPGSGRLERGRVRQRRRRRHVPPARRLPRRNDPAVAPPLVGTRPSRSRDASTVHATSVRAAAGAGRALPIVIGGRSDAAMPAGRAARGRIPRELR